MWAELWLVLVQGEGGLDNINLFSIITILSFFLLLPFNLVLEGWKLSPQGLAAMVGGVGCTGPHRCDTERAVCCAASLAQGSGQNVQLQSWLQY